jgi:sugar phosphate permease
LGGLQMGPVRCAASSDAEIVNRRAMIAAAAASVLAIATPAFAVTEGTPQKAGFGLQDQVKKGSKEARKKFANICVSNPTASICHG